MSVIVVLPLGRGTGRGLAATAFAPALLARRPPYGASSPMAAQAPIAFVPRPSTGEPRGGLLDALLGAFGLDRRTRAFDRALYAPEGHFYFAGYDLEAESAAAYEHYRGRLVAEGLDPERYADHVEFRVDAAYQRSFGLGVFDPATWRPARPAPQRREPTPGSFAAIRKEAKETFLVTGVYGLPSYGGHILTPEEERLYGVRCVD